MVSRAQWCDEANENNTLQTNLYTGERCRKCATTSDHARGRGFKNESTQFTAVPHSRSRAGTRRRISYSNDGFTIKVPILSISRLPYTPQSQKSHSCLRRRSSPVPGETAKRGTQRHTRKEDDTFGIMTHAEVAAVKTNVTTLTLWG